jgi:hypothetical protein
MLNDDLTEKEKVNIFLEERNKFLNRMKTLDKVDGFIPKIKK